MSTGTLRHSISIEQVSAALIPMLTSRELDRARWAIQYAIVARRTSDRRPTSVLALADRLGRLNRAAVEMARAYAALLDGVTPPPPVADTRTTAVCCRCDGPVSRQVAGVDGRAVPFWVHDHAIVGVHAARPGLADLVVTA